MPDQVEIEIKAITKPNPNPFDFLYFLGHMAADSHSEMAVAAICEDYGVAARAKGDAQIYRLIYGQYLKFLMTGEMP